MQQEIIPTNRKALKINIDTPFYGSFAEIGGGQETSRHFFQVGGASGTIAKSISAYDKSFSDLQYNNKKAGRYFSEERLVKMIDDGNITRLRQTSLLYGVQPIFTKQPKSGSKFIADVMPSYWKINWLKKAIH